MPCRKIIAVCSEIHTKDINTVCGQNVQFLGAFAKLRRAKNSFVMSIRPSARNNSHYTGRILINFGIWVFFANLFRNFKFHWNRRRITGTLHEDTHTYISYLARYFLELSQLCARAQERQEPPFQRCVKGRGLLFTKRSSIRQTSTAVKDVTHFSKPYGHWQSTLRVGAASSADNVSEMTMKYFKVRISLGTCTPRPPMYH
jgi:hypothetical protein